MVQVSIGVPHLGRHPGEMGRGCLAISLNRNFRFQVPLATTDCPSFEVDLV
jgi:hypothetical protein